MGNRNSLSGVFDTLLLLIITLPNAYTLGFSRNPEIEDIIRIAVATAMRRGEILALRPDHNLKDRSLLIPGTKNGEARTIPLQDAAVSIVRERMNRKALIWRFLSRPTPSDWPGTDLNGELRSATFIFMNFGTKRSASFLRRASPE
jgi:integrase